MQFNKNNSSVEHLAPRKISDTSWNIDENEHSEWLHKLGNLVLIDRRKNASLSNRLFSDKKIRYQGAIETRANTNFVFMNNSSWDISTIRQNHRRVINILKRYYEGNSIETIVSMKTEISNQYNNSNLTLPM